jgi:hypothetical protein
MAVRTIGIDELDGFQLDEAGQLYWRGQAVVLRQRITLGTWELAVAAVASAAAAVGAIFPIGVYFHWY